MNKKTEKTRPEKNEERGRPVGTDRDEGDIERTGKKNGIGGEQAGGGRPVRDKKKSDR